MRKVRAEAAASAAAVATQTALRRQDEQQIVLLQSTLREAVDRQGSLAALLVVCREGIASQHGLAQATEPTVELTDSDDPWSWTTSDEEDGGLDLAERGAAGTALVLLTRPGAGREQAATPAACMRTASSPATPRDSDGGSLDTRLPTTPPHGAAPSGPKCAGDSASPLGLLSDGRVIMPAGACNGGGSPQPEASLSPDGSTGVDTIGDQENRPPACVQPVRGGRLNEAQVCSHVLPASCQNTCAQRALTCHASLQPGC
jgi:hypothetical protein